ncbi:AbrB/MazE/SpoVT family DNA-binding domain-containing protein [Actimicrobium sp. CCI2.3]|uniref:AbrB/MazE/SpoVT family DNA-binding domain-containing protein n=1 Tax=Actimicrobium sp. CCI2.3 TaxID=3048616 RepID=UPI002AB5905E|nr:AbrB/MazE/SpoVT family DNA-binding domain-containing protein [Actimicrobium sp. CCI2.3]MDY7576131.1 AbrB/MazE/SpoVT family DNA-binding domain-containing protein [Actimicrobium sp. CCI2.3]MEB0023467.1 AbrB/MazE/SpoVT family DNA-binding domain-containing protein [Actimicrobium sp. CCI2.3]
MLIAIRRIGNSKGIIIPTSILSQLGLETEADVSVVDGAMVVRVPARPNRSGWADASKAIALAGDDVLVMPEYANADDALLSW